MLQMVRTLAQFTIALEDMRDIGDGIDAAFATSGLSGAAEELPDKGCGSRGGTEVMPRGSRGGAGGMRGRGGGAGMRHDRTRVRYPAPVGSAPPWQPRLHPHPHPRPRASILIPIPVPPSSSSPRHPRDLRIVGRGSWGGWSHRCHPPRC